MLTVGIDISAGSGNAFIFLDLGTDNEVSVLEIDVFGVIASVIDGLSVGTELSYTPEPKSRCYNRNTPSRYTAYEMDKQS